MFIWDTLVNGFERLQPPRRWAAVPDDEWPAEEAQQATILADFDPATEWGDRRSAPYKNIAIVLVQQESHF